MAKLKDTSKQTDLSIKIREYISKSGIPVYKIAQTSGLGRASIQHIMSGYMFPSKEFLDKLIHALYLTPKEKIELYDLYQQEKIGKGEYYNRQILKTLIEGIDDGSRRSGIVFDKIRLPQSDILPYSVISGEKEVDITILQCVAASLSNKSHRAPYLYTNIPRISDELCYAMKEFLIEKAVPKTAVVHFTKLVKHDPKQKNDNIIALKNILQIASYMNTCYKPYAYYSTTDQGEELITAFPYFFVTDDYVIQISTDMTRSFIISDAGYVREYHDHCSKLMSLSVEMLNTFTPKEKFDVFFNSAPILYQTIESQPSLTQYFTFEIIDKYLPDTPEKELFLARCIDLLKMSDDLDKKCQA